MDSRQALIDRSIPFLQEVKDMTPGAEMERWLNTKYGPESPLYRDLSRLIKLGVEEGWAAHTEIAGANYRRSRIMAPAPETFHFSNHCARRLHVDCGIGIPVNDELGNVLHSFDTLRIAET